MDEKLKQVLQRVELLCNQNLEFRNELVKWLRIPLSGSALPDISQAVAVDDKANRIEQYLGLDYSLDSADSIIDYSYIESESVEKQLISDNREMMRFRYGTRSHAIDFPEFCHYAMLQAEMLLNYYYETKHNGKIFEIKEDIATNNTYAKIESYTSLAAIPFNIKVWAFRTEHNFSNTDFDMNVLNNVRSMRNDLSHRAPEKKIEQDLLDYRKSIEKQGLPLTAKGEVNTWAIKDNPTKMACWNRLRDMPEYKNYCFALWFQRKDFDEVAHFLSNFSNAIKEKLLPPQ